MKFLHPTVSLIALFFSITVLGQAFPETQKRTIEGMVVNELGSPVTLSDASMEVIENQSEPNRSSNVHHQVRILKNTDLDIKTVGLIISMEFDSGSIITLPTTVEWKRLNDGRLSIQNMKMSQPEPLITDRLIFRISGVSFTDGSRWVPPRSDNFLMYASSIRNRNSPARISDYRKIANDYRMKLKFTTDNIVAYRLGILKDTPQEFSVRLADWITIDQSVVSKNKEIEILGSTEMLGFKKEDIFKPESHTRYSRTGQVIKREHGVAFFVAEVRFADGKVWQQNIAREFLVWDE